MNLFTELLKCLDGWLWDWLNARSILIALIALIFVPPILFLIRKGAGLFADRRRQSQSRWLKEPRGNESSGLIVLTHGLNKSVEDLDTLAKYIAETPGHENHDVYLYDYAAGLASNAAPGSLAIEMGAELAEIFEKNAPKDPNYEIILIGHSLGGLIVRKAWLDAVSEHLNNPEHEDYEGSWAAKVKKIVLLASPNRGSSVYDRNFLRRWMQYYPARILGIGALGLSVLRGSRFIVKLRLDWIRTYRQLHSVPAVAQFVGRRDPVVALEDSIDVVAMPNAYQPEPFDDLDHSSILTSRACYIRVRKFLLETQREEQDKEERKAFAVLGGETVKVLVMHGIRDFGERFQGKIKPVLEAGIRELGKKPIVRAPRYRYFTALSFLLPWTRERRVRDFVDEYSNLVATPPQLADVHFVGHSFGTYQLGAALQNYDEIRFGRVYLAGSVLKEDFDWARHLEAPQDYRLEQEIHASEKRMERKPKVEALCNTAACKDWPVGLLCAGIRLLRLSNLIGSGGYNGFTIDREDIVQLKYYEGGHSAAIDGSDDCNVIADWILKRCPDGSDFIAAARERLKENTLVDDRPNRWIKFHKWIPKAALLIAALVILPWFIFPACPGIWIISPVTLALAIFVTKFV